MPITISLARINWALGLVVLVLTLLGLTSEILLSVYHEDWAYGLVPLLNLSYDTNIPTWYSSILLMACAGLLAGIARIKHGQRAPYRRHWAAMALILAYLSVDELAHFHEMINPALSDPYNLGGIFVFSWVIPFAILVVLFAVSYFGFLRHLSRRFQVWFMTAGALYAGGALGTELMISFWHDARGGGNLVYGLLNLVQESLEILGATVFFSALLAYVSAEIGELRIHLHEKLPTKRVRHTEPPPEESISDKLKSRYLLRYERS